jgi:hypothetical protein
VCCLRLTDSGRDKETPLHKAALYGSLPVVKTLVEAKVDVNAKAKSVARCCSCLFVRID